MSSYPARKTFTSIRLVNFLEKAIVYAILLAGTLVILTPFWWMVTTSLKTPAEVFTFPPTFLPHKIIWKNYVDIFQKAPFLLYFRNTIYVVLLDMIGTLLSASLVGFAFARLRWRGRDLLFLITLATMMLPGAVILIPRYLIFKELHWLDSFRPLWVPSFFGYAFFIFLMRQFYTTIPFDLDDAALIDGCSHFGVWWRILLPLTRPAMAACAIFTFNATWNDFLGPIIYLSSQDKLTLALGLLNFRGPHTTDWHYLMASSVVAMMPVILLYFFAQKYFIQGVVFTGVKG
ncbi:MAG: carbohydrate ABC transporter permease [Chloroflexi bacterium]|nr:carbohydrate ABC transporter permease [Chloroflexota bacterium]